MPFSSCQHILTLLVFPQAVVFFSILTFFFCFSAGQERFRTLTSAYYRGAQGIILVYDITDRSSFENLSHWLSEVDLYSTNDSAVKLLIGNKSDQFDHRTVTKSEANEFAQQHGMIYIEASAKTQEGINQAFDELIQQILDVPELVAEGSGSSGGNNSSKSNGGYGGSGGSSVNMSNAFDEDRQTSRGPCGGFCPA